MNDEMNNRKQARQNRAKTDSQRAQTIDEMNKRKQARRNEQAIIGRSLKVDINTQSDFFSSATTL